MKDGANEVPEVPDTVEAGGSLPAGQARSGGLVVLSMWVYAY